MLKFRTLPRVALIAFWCVAFLGGLGLVQADWRVQDWVWLVVATVVLAGCIRRTLLWALPAVIISGALFGMWRGTHVTTQLAQYQSYIGAKVAVTGIATGDATYTNKHMADLRLEQVRVNGHPLPGQVRITTFAPIEPNRGDAIEAKGKLYAGFGNYQAAIYYADAQVTQPSHAPIDTLRRYFAASVLSNVPEPQASLGLGFLLGIKSQLPDDLNAQLQALSLTHIVVASGYNLTILVRVVRRFFEKHSKFQTVALSAVLMAGFVAVTGLTSSMSRAALVTGLVLAAWYYGRRVHPAVVLLMASAITAGLNPLFLWSDVGWWLSFAAFAGVLLLAPLLQRRIFGARQPKLIGQVVIETIAAQLLALPLILFIFGDLSLLALPANVLIVPAIPLAMLLTFIAGLAGLVAGPIAGVLAWPASVLLGYMVELIRLFAQFPLATIKFTIALPVMVGLYAAILMLGVFLWRKTKLRYLEQSVIE